MILERNHIANNWTSFEEFRLKKVKGLQTGFSKVDNALVSLPGLVTVMGDTGCGKSTFVMNTLVHNARKKIPVVWLDKENGLQRTRKRLLCHRS